MISTDTLKRLNRLTVAACVTYITILLLCNHYYPPVDLVYFYVSIPFIVLLYISKVMIIKRNDLETKFSIKLSPEQYKKAVEIAHKHNKSVNQYWVDIIDERLNEKDQS